jgi:hypothetical protein
MSQKFKTKKNRLRKEYANIKKDKEQLQAMKDWESAVGDGLEDCGPISINVVITKK